METGGLHPARSRPQGASHGRRAAEPHLLDRLNVLYRYRRVAISAFVIILLGVALRTYSQTPMYRAHVRLLIELEDERSLLMEGVNGSSNSSAYAQDPEPYFQTQYRILTGRELASRIARRIDLARVPELTGIDAPQTEVARMLASTRAAVVTPLRALLGRPTTSQSRGATPSVSEEALKDGLISRVSVEPIQSSRLVDVVFVAAEPEFAARAVNTLGEEYVAQNLELRQQTMTKSLEWLSQELVRQQRKVEDSERALAQYREDQNALSLEDRQNIVIARLNQLNDAATRARTNRVQKESLYKQIESLGVSVSADTIPAILQNPYIQSVKARLADLKRQKTHLAERYGEKYPDMITVNASIQDVTEQLRLELAKAIEAVRNDYQSAIIEERTLNGALEDQKAAATDLNRKSVSYTVLEREAHSNRQIYETLLQREKELQVLANSRGNNVRLVDRAQVPQAPFSPAVRRSLILGSLVAAMIAIGLAVGLDYLDDTIRTPADITRKLGLPCLGLVPAVKGGSARPVLSPTVSSDFGEAIRTLRTSVVFSHTTEGSAVVLVTSAQPLEGKTTTACNLAMSLAYGGARVLLIDADLRRPSVHRGFGLDNAQGLSELLSGQAYLSEVVQRLADPDLWIMTAGAPPPNPSELLASVRMDALMTQARTGPFDWVIIDTPPVLAVTDASILTRWASGVAFVLGSGMTRRRIAEDAIEALAASNPRNVGVVLNRVDFARDRYYYSRYYGYKSKRLPFPAAA